MKTKASTSKGRSSGGAKRHHAKSRPVRKSSRRPGPKAGKKPRSFVPELVGFAPGGIAPAIPTDKRDDELTDEESLDREERQDLY